MEVKISFDGEKLKEWFDGDCEIECENCPLEGYMCDTLLSKGYDEYCKQVWKDDDNK